MIWRLVALCFLMAGAVSAQTLEFPSNASLQIDRESPLESYTLPTGIWDRGTMPTREVEGQFSQQAWRIDAVSLTTLQLLRPLREQLRNDRFNIIFDCQTEACGGFDFRFAIETLPPPEMRVNIGDFRFLAAERAGENGEEYVTLLVSRTSQAGYVQITRVAPLASTPPPLARTSAFSPGVVLIDGDDALSAMLENRGRAVLADLKFATGSAQLDDAEFSSLEALASYLSAFPQRSVALVGHTDASGSLDANIALSKRRAASVLERLVSDYGVSRRQLEAEGMGYLAPISSNLTEEGRDANRRVEVIITSTRE